MYSFQQISRIMDFYRNTALHLPISTLDDIKVNPNDALLTEYISSKKVGKKQLASDLRDLPSLGKKLRDVTQRKASESDPPVIYDSLDFNNPQIFASSVKTRNGKFALAYGEGIVVADKQRKRFTFPSGFQVDYHLLVNEQSANISIFDGAYASIDPEQIFVRQNFLTMIGALYGVVSPNSNHKNRALDFSEAAIAILLAHEVSEIEIMKSGSVPEDRLELELESEKRARTLIAQHGISPEDYELFHTLRAGNDNLDVSRAVLAHLKPAC